MRLDRALERLDRRRRADRAHHVRERLRDPGGIEDEPDDRDQRDQRGEDREHAVVGERRRPVGELVLLELGERPLERLPERTLARVRGTFRDAAGTLLPAVPFKPRVHARPFSMALITVSSWGRTRRYPRVARRQSRRARDPVLGHIAERSRAMCPVGGTTWRRTRHRSRGAWGRRCVVRSEDGPPGRRHLGDAELLTSPGTKGCPPSSAASPRPATLSRDRRLRGRGGVGLREAADVANVRFD